jgi:hypothetical protein
MTRPVITALPAAPTRGEDPATFAAKANTFVAALPAYGTESNALGVFMENEADAAQASRIAAEAAETGAEAAETAAQASASAASGSASSASASASTATTAANNAAASYDDFDDRYLGEKASDPTVDNDGDALITGALYFNNASDEMRVYNGTAFQQVAPVATSINLETQTTGVLPIDSGGTGAATLTANNVLLGNGTSALQVVAPGSSGNILTSDGTTWTSTAPAGGVSDNQIVVHTSNGFGSSGTTIRRFTTTLTQVGSAITYVDSSSNGASFTINENGFYAISFTNAGSANSNLHGISLNSNQLSTSIGSITIAHRIALVYTYISGGHSTAHSVIRLVSGDVIRPHTDGSTGNNGPEYFRFEIRKIGVTL